jgi:hypothetical protein
MCYRPQDPNKSTGTLDSRNRVSVVIACPHCTGASSRLQELHFSKLVCIKDEQRNSLDEEHVNA